MIRNALPRGSAAFALTALLAGCAGGSQITPAGNAPASTGPQSALRGTSGFAQLLGVKNAEQVRYSAHNRPGPLPQRLMKHGLQHAAGVRPSAIAFKQDVGLKKPPPLNYIFTSDNYTGDINIYDEATLTLLGQGAGFGGWGVAADNKGHVCWGTFNGQVACGAVTASGWTPTAYLNESYGQGYGMAFTSNGDLYVTNFGSASIDHYTKYQVAGCSGSGCSPASTFEVVGFSEPYFLAADGAKLYVTGIDAEYSNVLVGSVNVKSGKFKEIQSQPTSGFFPGGIAFDKSHTLIWDNQFGVMYALPKPYEYASSYVVYDNGYNPYDYSAITLDSSESDVIAANTWLCSSDNEDLCSNAQENSYPLGSVGLASGQNGDISDVGIAITPPGKN